MGLFRTARKPFLETNAWKRQNQNSLQYNTSQAGSVVPIVFGTMRVPVNVIDIPPDSFTGPTGGKKGGTGTIPLTGTNTTRSGTKGGGSSKGKGGKKGGGDDYKVDVAFGVCQGPVDTPLQVFANASVEPWVDAGLNFYSGADGQAADPVLAAEGSTVGYSGTAVITGTPMDLGKSPALPNISVEQPGFYNGAAGAPDANPADIVFGYLSDDRWGVGFPAINIDPDIATTYGDYCYAADLLMSPVLQTQQQAHEHIDGIAKLTNTAIVWSGNLLKMIPFGDLAITGNGVTWTPNLIPEYSLTDDDFLPWHESQPGTIQDGQDDPVLITRSNPADALNWMTIEYKDRINYYNPTVVPDFDQGAIDTYGLRTGESVQGHAFTVADRAKNSLRLILQRALFDRNAYKFRLGWRFALLEPMDIVLITEKAAGLFEYPVRITAVSEDDNGDLTVEAEQISVPLPLPLPDDCLDVAALPPPVCVGLPTLDGSATASVDYLSQATSLPVSLTTSQSGDVIFVAVAIGSFDSGALLDVDTQVASVSGAGLTWALRKQATILGRTAGPGEVRRLDLEVWWASAPLPISSTITINFTGRADGAAAVAFGMAGTTDYISPFDATATPRGYSSLSPVPTALTVSGMSTGNPCDAVLAFCADMNAWTGTGFLFGAPGVSYTFVGHTYGSGDDLPSAPTNGGWAPSIGVWFLPVEPVQSPITPASLQNFAPYGWISIVDAIKGT